jgi:hypothetical protein
VCGFPRYARKTAHKIGKYHAAGILSLPKGRRLLPETRVTA